ncbi:MAG: hypothetical protein Q6J68_07740 [Thermostichales cyanobacterium SZTDM-1c_bins_54]
MIWPVQIWNQQTYIHGDPQPFMYLEAEVLREVPVRFRVAEPQPASRDFAWALSRIVRAEALNRAVAAQFHLHPCLAAWVSHWQQTPAIPPVQQVLIALELLVRGIPIPLQQQLQVSFGEDVMRAAHQMNIACIDPDNADRTLLQVQRLGLRLAGEQGSRLRAELQLVLGDGRWLDLI